ncbi:MAG: type II toxin-antitoxin system HicB family antitoxin [Pseudomonadota bacterium]
MTNYIALIRKERGSAYGVDFPDFPGCITAGNTLEEARQRASEALSFHIAGMVEDGDPIPEPTPLDTIMADPDNADAVAFLVSVANRPSKKVRVNIILPEDDLGRIDSYAKQVRLTRSAFLLMAAKRAMRQNA